MLTVPNELALTESRTMRAATLDRTEVLDKVKALTLLPDGMHVTTEMVANYYEVDVEAIKSLARRHRNEFEENGLQTLRGDDLRNFEGVNLTLSTEGSHNRRSLRVFARRTILNVGQLLTDSDVARAIRTHLLDVGEQETGSLLVPASFADALELAARQAREIEELAATNAKLSPKAARADRYEANPGITPTVFHKTHFPAIGEREFFEHLYRKDYLIDQRNARWDERKQEWKPGPEHEHPTAKGKRYFYLAPKLDKRGVRRQQTLVIPGNAEHDLVGALERDGLPSRNQPHIPGAEVVAIPRQRKGIAS